MAGKSKQDKPGASKGNKGQQQQGSASNSNYKGNKRPYQQDWSNGRNRQDQGGRPNKFQKKGKGKPNYQKGQGESRD